MRNGKQVKYQDGRRTARKLRPLAMVQGRVYGARRVSTTTLCQTPLSNATPKAKRATLNRLFTMPILHLKST